MIQDITKYQYQIIHSKAKHLSIYCGRRTGKTEAIKLRCAMNLASKKKFNIAVFEPNWRNAKNVFFNPFINYYKAYFPNTIKRISYSDLSITTNVGNDPKYENTLRMFTHEKPENIEGYTSSEIIIDEVQFWKDWNILDEAVTPTLGTTNGQTLYIGTPLDKDVWYDRTMFDDGFTSLTWTTLEGGLVSNEFIEEQKSRVDPRTFRMKYLGEFVESTGLIAYRFSEDNITTVDFDPDRPTRLSFDFNVSPMTCVVAQKHEDKVYIVKEFELFSSNTHDCANRVKMYLQENGKVDGHLTISGDASGNSMNTKGGTQSDYRIIKDILNEYRIGTERTRHVKKIEERFNYLNSAFKSASGKITYMIDSRCKYIIRSLGKVTRDHFRTGGDPQNLTHIFDALNYDMYNNFNMYKTK